MPTASKIINLALKRVLVNRSAPKQAHHMVFSRHDDEFILEVGYIDLVELGTATSEASSKEADEPVPVPFYVTDRFCMNRESWARVKKSFIEFDDKPANEGAEQ